ncbi:hypothetical protein HK405_000032, partial [Cladochytrium tenue]
DIAKNEVRSVTRLNGVAKQLPMDGLAATVSSTLDAIQREMFERARAERDAHLVRLESWDNFVKTLDAKNIVLAPWCERVQCEKDVKERSSRQVSEGEQDERAPSMGAKTLCIPFDQPKENPLVPGVTKCFACGQDAKSYTLWGRSPGPRPWKQAAKKLAQLPGLVREQPQPLLIVHELQLPQEMTRHGGGAGTATAPPQAPALPTTPTGARGAAIEPTGPTVAVRRGARVPLCGNLALTAAAVDSSVAPVAAASVSAAVAADPNAATSSASKKQSSGLSGCSNALARRAGIS